MDLAIGTPELDVAVQLSSRGFVQPVTTDLEKDVEAHIEGDLVLRIREAGIDIGFATFSLHGDYGELLYLNGIMLDPGAQGQSFAQRVIGFAQEATGARYLALRTQNPKMWAVGRKVCSEWLPDPQDGDISGSVQDVINILARERQLPHPVHVGCYGEPLYGDKPLHRDLDIQRWWDQLCNFDRGDGVVCVGVLRPAHP